MTASTFALSLSKDITKLPSYSDKAILPLSVLESLLSTYGDNLASPLIFKATNSANNITTFLGVREFTAKNDEIILPEVMVLKLGLDQAYSGTITILLLTDIPKGEALSLQPINALSTERNVINIKYFLEANLSHSYTTLTKGDVLLIARSPNETLDFRVTETSPGNTICLINTDLVFDLLPMDDEDAERMLKLKQKLLGNSAKDKFEPVDLSGNVYDIKQLELAENLVLDVLLSKQLYKVELGLLKGPCNVKVGLKPLSDGLEFKRDAELLISVDAFINSKAFIWSTAGSEESLVVIPGDELLLLNAQSLFILGYGEFEVGSKDIYIQVVPQESAEVPSHALDEDTSICKNCSREIKKKNLLLHESFCFRNNVKCTQGCNQIFLKAIPKMHWHCDRCNAWGNDEASFRRHTKFNHEAATCTCLQEFESFSLLAKHRATDCETKLHECRFCHLILPKGKTEPVDAIVNLSHHENTVCGLKTTNCYKCERVVKQRDLENHLRMHEVDRLVKNKNVQLVKCYNENCVNILSLKRSSDDLNELFGLCETCFSQFYSTFNDPNHKKLYSRIERRYMIQLTRGCGHGFCKNRECLSSGIPIKRTSKEIYSHVVNDLMSCIPNINIGELFLSSNVVKYFFCVNELLTKRGILVEHLYERLSDKYDYVWVCKAVSSLKVDLEDRLNFSKIETWLADHAVTLKEQS